MMHKVFTIINDYKLCFKYEDYLVLIKKGITINEYFMSVLL